MTHHPPPSKRLLLIDGSPGATTLLVLAAHRAITTFDTVLAPDTGWYPEQTQRHLDTLRHIAAEADMDWVRADTGDTAQDSLDSLLPCPLPLFTLTADGAPGYRPQGCARRQGVALSAAVRRLLGYPRPVPVPDGILAECATGTGLEQARAPIAAGPRYVRYRRPLADIGWTSEDCRAFLYHHGLHDGADLACTACPRRSNRSWRHLRATDPAAFAEAVAVDTTLRHGHPDPALRGMPTGTTHYLHPDRVPLDQVDLTPDSGPEPSGCTPWACRGHGSEDTEGKGGTR